MREVGERLDADGRLIVELARRRVMPPRVDGLEQVRRVASANSALAFYAHGTRADGNGER